MTFNGKSDLLYNTCRKVDSCKSKRSNKFVTHDRTPSLCCIEEDDTLYIQQTSKRGNVCTVSLCIIPYRHSYTRILLKDHLNEPVFQTLKFYKYL